MPSAYSWYSVEPEDGMHFFPALRNLLILLICADDVVQGETDVICMEDRMRSLGLLYSESDCASNNELCSTLLKGIDLEATLPTKKVSCESVCVF